MIPKVRPEDLSPFTLSSEERLAAPGAPKRKRKLHRPTTPELEALYFRVNLLLTKREAAIFMWAMGRSEDKGDALASLFLSPEPTT